MKILLTGATGLVGKELGKSLIASGHELVVVSRSREKALKSLPFSCQIIEGDLVSSVVPISMVVDGVIHLLGESVADHRWNEKVKKDILSSRVQSSYNLIQSLNTAPQFFISASAIGFYGHRPGEVLTENSFNDESFLSQVCVQWERSAFSIKEKFPNTLVAAIRIGLVLSADGGALKKMLMPFKLGLGGVLGSGQQYMSWIHLQDLVRMFIFVMDNKLSGIFNGVAPTPVTNEEFSKALAQTLNRPLGPAIPQWVLRLALGEMSKVIVSDQKVSSQKIQEQGFKFDFPVLIQALNKLFS